jgi:hypothetical protein
MHHLLCILLLLPLVAHAQDPATVQPGGSPFGHTFWASAADSTDFIAFHRAMIMGEETLETTSGDYHAVWRVGEHGGLAMVSRGDGSLWRIEGTSVIGVFMQLPFRMADGRRGFMVVHETPCGLLCRDTMYYLEK